MGSSWFYAEFLVAWISCLKEHGSFKNPLVVAVEYTLVPDEVWPCQIEEVRATYRYVAQYMGSTNKIVVAGDSAGATLILSNLLSHVGPKEKPVIQEHLKPGLAVLISPWTHLVSNLNRNTQSDYLDSDSLHLYARQYAGECDVNDPILSPGLSIGRWKEASPKHGYYFIYGEEEVFANAIAETIADMKKHRVKVRQTKKKNGIHAWPVVSLFLGNTRCERLEGLEKITEVVSDTLR